MIPQTISALTGVAILLVTSSPSLAYDLITHARLTERAFTQSQGLRNYLRDGGYGAASALDLGRTTPSLQLAGYENDATPLGWVVEGAIREDDYSTNLSLVGCESPRNPPSTIDRVRHHFYDPDTNHGLNLGNLNGLPASEWALGEQGRGPGASENQFSWA